MSGERMNYKFGQKNHWRRTIWNAIAERLSVPAKDAVVLYLGGQSDLDRNVAMSKGFRSDNLIFVDRSRSVCEKARRCGALAVAGEFLDVAFSVPPSLNVHVVFGDTCAGLYERFWNRSRILCMAPQVRHAVFAFNFLRGRDPDAAKLTGPRKERGDMWNHRGLAFRNACLVASLELVTNFARLRSFPDGIGFEMTERYSADAWKGMVNKQWANLLAFSQPVEYSYRSTARQTFDSAVFINPWRGVTPGQEQLSVDRWLLRYLSSRRIRSQFSAICAHRTMRRKRIGPYARSGA